MFEIRNVLRESHPTLRLIGRRYTDADRVDGLFGARWAEWFEGGLFEVLESAGAPEHDGAYLGAMRVVSGAFEYWIGMAFPEDAAPPDGFECAPLPAGDLGVCWVYGREELGEVYGMDVHRACVRALADAGMAIAPDPWVIERYNCPRFTTPDATGRVILDYAIALL